MARRLIESHNGILAFRHQSQLGDRCRQFLDSKAATFKAQLRWHSAHTRWCNVPEKRTCFAIVLCEYLYPPEEDFFSHRWLLGVLQYGARELSIYHEYSDQRDERYRFDGGSYKAFEYLGRLTAGIDSLLFQMTTEAKLATGLVTAADLADAAVKAPPRKFRGLSLRGA